MRITLEARTPFDRSILWRLTHAYWQQRGPAAWRAGEVPYHATSNFTAARNHAALVAALVADAEAEGTLGPAERVWVLEAGCGVGDFCANFMAAAEADQPALFARLGYLVTDYSPHNLARVSAAPRVAPWIARGVVIPARFDLHDPGVITRTDGVPFDDRITFVVTNYVCCVIPMRHLQKHADGTWRELETEVMADVDDPDDARPAALEAALLEDATRTNLTRNLEVHYHWQPVDLGTVLGDGLHREVLTSHLRDLPEATIGYPDRYLDFVGRMLPLMRPGGAILTNDYGSTQRSRLAGHHDRRPQIYGNSLAQDTNMSVFETFADALGFAALRSQSDLYSVHSALLSARAFGPRATALFQARYLAEHANDRLLDESYNARKAALAKEPARALRAWLRCIEMDPFSAELRFRAGELAIEAGFFDLAVEQLEHAVALDLEHAWDVEFHLGRAHSLANRHPQALDWYRRSLERTPHPITHTNIGVVHEHDGRLDDAWRSFQSALALDPECERALAGLERLKAHAWKRVEQAFREGRNPVP
jgi:tetratricopeptide (TPR) repeat protein